MATKTIRIGATTDIILRRLKHERTGAYPTAADVTFTLFTGAGDPVAGATELPMTYVGGTNPNDGIYTGELPATITVDLTDGAAYSILIIASAPDGSIRPFPLACVARL